MASSKDDASTILLPLYVDLDGTFIKSDMLFESFLRAVKSNPLLIISIFGWLLKGRSYLKHKLALLDTTDVSVLPLNQDFYNFLNAEKSKGRKLILATASNITQAQKISEAHPIFDDVIASTEEINLKGNKKLEQIKQQSKYFAYAGNSTEDMPLFDSADESYLVNPNFRSKKLVNSTKFAGVYDHKSLTITTWIKQLRVYQWSKNALIFVPLFVSGLFLNIELVLDVIVGTLSFGLLASSTYIINDLLDLDADRNHHKKKNRPLASSDISIQQGIFASALLMLISLVVSWQLSESFFLVILLYLFSTLFYSLKVKQYLIMDVIALASLYTMRIFAGAFLIDTIMSFWLLSFSMFIFLSLALVKRCAELVNRPDGGTTVIVGRGYIKDDYYLLSSFGASSALLAVLMFCFYVNNNALTNQYQEPHILWLILPALCYWLMRMWIKTHRGEMHDDPIVYSLKDKGSLITVLFIALITLSAQIL